MDFVTKEREVFGFIAPFGIFVRGIGTQMRRVNTEGDVFVLYNAEALGNEIHKDLMKCIFTESFSEVMEGVVRGCVSKGQSTEVAHSGIIAEFSGEVSFGGSLTKIDKKNGFEQTNRVKAFVFRGVFVSKDIANRSPVNRFKEDFQGVIRWDKGSNFEVNETELRVFSHLMASFLRDLEEEIAVNTNIVSSQSLNFQGFERC
jgi:hypothetical protein